VSLAGLLAEIASERHAEAALSSERDASRTDAQSPDVATEDRDWEASLADGID